MGFNAYLVRNIFHTKSLLHAMLWLCKLPQWLHEFGSGSTFVNWEESVMAAFPACAKINIHNMHFWYSIL